MPRMTTRKKTVSEEASEVVPAVCGHRTATFVGQTEHPDQLCECELPLGHGGPHQCRIDHTTFTF